MPEMVLTPDDTILEDIVLDPIVPDFAPSLYWALDGRNGANDLSGNGNAGTAVSVSFGNSTATPEGWTESTDLDGAADYITSSYAPFSDSESRTYTGWANRDGTADVDVLFGGNAGTTSPNLFITVANYVTWRTDRTDTGATSNATFTAAWPGTAQWVHWALIYNPTADTADLYINAVAQTQVTGLTKAFSGAGTLVVGTDDRGAVSASFDGKLAHFAVYERALTAGEVGALYQRGASALRKRTELPINDGAIRIMADPGPDWGNAELQQYQAEAARGQIAVDFRYPNRQSTLPLVVQEGGGTTYIDARSNLHAKVARIQQEGGVLKRALSTGGTLYMDIVGASLTQGNQWLAAHQQVEHGITLNLEATPDLYGNEVALDDHSETTDRELIFTEDTINGDYPTRVRWMVDEDDGENQRGLLWSLRSLHYSPATTAQLAYDAKDLEPLGTAGTGLLLSGATAVTQGTLSANWQSVLGTDIGGTAALTHTGTYRVYVGAISTDGTAVSIRLAWGVGDALTPSENPAKAIPSSTLGEYILDLGEIRLDQAQTGAHVWQGQIQARGTNGGEDITLDRIWLANTDEGYGLLSAPTIASSYANTASDSFNQSAGNLTGKTADTGETWGGAGDADDFTVGTIDLIAQRTAVSDSALTNGRFATLSSPTTATAVRVRCAIRFTAVTAGRFGVLARYTDTSNYLLFAFNPNTASWSLYKVISGSVTTLATVNTPNPVFIDQWAAPILTVDEDGNYQLRAHISGATEDLGSGQDDDLKTGGTLEDGKVGIYDAQASGAANTRSYNDFQADYSAAADTPDSGAVMFANQSVILATEGIVRADFVGTAWGPVARVTGDLPRLPVSGLEGRPVEFFLKASRGDFGDLPDSAVADDISARVFYRPSYLFAPE